VSSVFIQIKWVLGHSKANMVYYQVYLFQSNTSTCHCVTSQIVWNSQTLGQFFEPLYIQIWMPVEYRALKFKLWSHLSGVWNCAFGLCCHALLSERLVRVFCIIGCIVYIQFSNAYGIQGIEIEIVVTVEWSLNLCALDCVIILCITEW